MKHLLSFTCSALFVCGCAPTPSTPPAMHSTQLSSQILQESDHYTSISTSNEEWWKSLEEYKLSDLISHALKETPKLSMLKARIQQSLAEYDIAEIGTKPSVDFFATVDTNRPSRHDLISPPLVPTSYQIGKIGLMASYDMDIWGKLQAQLAMKIGLIKAQQAEFDASVVTLSYALGVEYFRSAYLNDKHHLLKDEQKVVQALYVLALERYNAGIDDSVAVLNLQSRLNEVKRAITQIETLKKASHKALANLAGVSMQEVTHYLPSTLNEPNVFKSLPTVMLDTLALKPEIRAKKEIVNAMSASMDVAVAGFYPNINLTAMVDFASLGLNNLLRTDSITKMASAGITLPLFDRHALENNYKASSSARDAAIYDYNDAIIRGGNELLYTLMQLKDTTKEQEFIEHDFQNKEALMHLAHVRFTQGIGDKRFVLQKELEILDTKNALLQNRFSHTVAYLELIHALGGHLAQGN